MDDKTLHTNCMWMYIDGRLFIFVLCFSLKIRLGMSCTWCVLNWSGCIDRIQNNKQTKKLYRIRKSEHRSISTKKKNKILLHLSPIVWLKWTKFKLKSKTKEEEEEKNSSNYFILAKSNWKQTMALHTNIDVMVCASVYKIPINSRVPIKHNLWREYIAVYDTHSVLHVIYKFILFISCVRERERKNPLSAKKR